MRTRTIGSITIGNQPTQVRGVGPRRALDHGQPGGLGQTVAQFGGRNGALAATAVAPPVALPQSVLTADNGDNWVCRNTRVEEKKNLDQLLAPVRTAALPSPVRPPWADDAAPRDLPSLR